MSTQPARWGNSPKSKAQPTEQIVVMPHDVEANMIEKRNVKPGLRGSMADSNDPTRILHFVCAKSAGDKVWIDESNLPPEVRAELGKLSVSQGRWLEVKTPGIRADFTGYDSRGNKVKAVLSRQRWFSKAKLNWQLAPSAQ